MKYAIQISLLYGIEMNQESRTILPRKSFLLIGRKIINDKYINKQAIISLNPIEIEEGLGIINLPHGCGMMLVDSHVRERITFGMIYCLETLIIGSWHDDINIVVPRNEAFMSYGSKQSAISQTIANIVFLAKICKMNENLKRNPFICYL